jgi:DNA-binding transcriptional LysR family regulator
MHLLPIAIEFLDSYPDIALRLVLTDRVVNTVSESIDVAIRIGTVPDSSMMAIRIGSVVAFASPAYLAAHSHPKNPSDLSTMIVLQQMMIAMARTPARCFSAYARCRNWPGKFWCRKRTFMRRRAKAARPR